MKTSYAILFLICASAMSTHMHAQGLSESAPAQNSMLVRTITVSGDAEVKVAPDQVTLTLGIETKNRELLLVKRQNGIRLKGIKSAINKLGISDRDVRNDYLNLQPVFEMDSSHKQVLVGYVQRTTIVILLKDIAKFDALVSNVLQAGVEYIHGVDFQTTELRRHRTEARVLAMRSANEKAIALAGELGQKVGKSRSIHEGQGGYWSSYGSWWGHGRSQGASQMMVQAPSASGAAAEGSVSPGDLSIRASVTVTFDLD